MQISPVGPALPLQAAGPAQKQASGNVSFPEMLQNALKEMNDAKINADQMTLKYLTGEVKDFHQVAIAMQEASLMTQMVVEVRNKVIEAYQEVSRMQV